MAQFLGPAFQQALSASAVPYSGGLLYVYQPSTTTPVSLFSDEDMMTPAANPMVADSSGSFTPVFLSETSVKLVLKTSAGVTVRTIDPVFTVGVSNVLAATDVSYNGSTSGLASETVQDAIDEAVALQGGTQAWSSASDGPIVVGTSTNAGAAAGPLVEMFRDSASPQTSDVIGGLRLTGRNASGTKTTMAQIHGVITDTTNASEDAGIAFQTVAAGAFADRFHIRQGVMTEGATDPGIGKANFLEVQQAGSAIRPLISGTVQATTSGTSKDFTSIPSWVKKITVTLNEVSTNGSSVPLIQIGDSGGVETSGYAGSGVGASGSGVAGVNGTAGFIVAAGHASDRIINGIATIALTDSATNTWNYRFAGSHRSGIDSGLTAGGSKALSATLDRVRLTTTNGTDAFDAGSVNILYE